MDIDLKTGEVLNIKGSVVEGSGTTVTNTNEHAEGSYNKSNTGTRHSVGIGSSANDLKNAFEIMDNGDIYVFGLGGYDGTNAGGAGVISLSGFLHTGVFLMNEGVPYNTSGEAEAAAATSSCAGNPKINVLLYNYNGTQRGIGTGYIMQSIYYTSSLNYECIQILCLAGKFHKRVITLAASPDASGLIPVVLVGAWAIQDYYAKPASGIPLSDLTISLQTLIQNSAPLVVPITINSSHVATLASGAPTKDEIKQALLSGRCVIGHNMIGNDISEVMSCTARDLDAVAPFATFFVGGVTSVYGNLDL